MMHQYIGARYVPIFYVNSQDPDSSEWENNVEYEPLVWVSLPNGNMYLSKKTVPASVGSPASNPNYWMTAGQFNAYIQSLQDQINDMQDGTIPGSLQDQINDNASDITALAKYVINRKIIMITDSYGNRQNSASKTVKDILTDRGHNIVYDVALSGGAFSQTNLSLKFSEYLDDYTGNHNDITDVIFCCGINERVYTYATIVSNVVSTVALAKTEYPNAKIHIIPWGSSFSNTISDVENMYNIVPYAYSDAANKSGAVIAKNAEYILRNSKLYESDLLHPNADGVDALAGQLDRYLQGNDIDVYYELETTVTLYSGVSGVTLTEAKNMVMRRHNGEVSIMSKTAGWGFFRLGFDNSQTGFVDFNPLFELQDTLFAIPNSFAQFWVSIKGSGLRSGQNIGAIAKMHFYAKYIRCTIAADDYSSIDGFSAYDNTIFVND